MSKQFWAVIAFVVIALIGVSIITSHKSNSSSGSSKGTATSTNHVEGKGTSGVKLTEFGDFQCPYCQVYSSTVKQVVADYGDQITFQFVNFPLTSLHQNAFAAARAAEAAGKQNKYWEMHDLLYQNNDPNGTTGWVASGNPLTYFNQYATSLGLNLTKFKTDYAASSTNDTINADLAKGNKLGVDGTPSFFINGKKVTIGNSAADFKKVIDGAIKTAGASATSSGTTSQTVAPDPAKQ